LCPHVEGDSIEVIFDVTRDFEGKYLIPSLTTYLVAHNNPLGQISTSRVCNASFECLLQTLEMNAENKLH
jgi:hypothetical protein